MRALRVELERVRQELGKKNIEYASLKVDVDREELALQKKCKHLEVGFMLTSIYTYMLTSIIYLCTLHCHKTGRLE